MVSLDGLPLVKPRTTADASGLDDNGFIAAFKAIQTLMTTPALYEPKLADLERDLAAALAGTLTTQPTGATYGEYPAFNALYDLLTIDEQRLGLNKVQIPWVSDLLSLTQFNDIAKDGFVLHDVGVLSSHGEFTHRIQISLLSRLSISEGKGSLDWTNFLAVYAALSDVHFEVPFSNFSGGVEPERDDDNNPVVYSAWDAIFDRLGGSAGLVAGEVATCPEDLQKKIIAEAATYPNLARILQSREEFCKADSDSIIDDYKNVQAAETSSPYPLATMFANR